MSCNACMLVQVVLLGAVIVAQCRIITSEGSERAADTHRNAADDIVSTRARRSFLSTFRRRLHERRRQQDAPRGDTPAPNDANAARRLTTVEENFRKLSSLLLHQTTVQQHLKGRLDGIRRDMNASLGELSEKARNQSGLLHEVAEGFTMQMEEFEDLNEKVEQLAQTAENELTEIRGKTQATESRVDQLSSQTATLQETVDNLPLQSDVTREEFEALQRHLAVLEERLNDTASRNSNGEQCSVVTALGMANGRIPNDAITGSDVYDSSYNPVHNARLNNALGWFTGLRTTTSYGRNRSDLDWLKVDLGEPYLITGVATQGANEHGFYRVWVTKYRLQFSMDGSSWQSYSNGNSQDINGNCDDASVARLDMRSAVRARYVKFEPLSFDCDEIYRPTCYLGMRVELYGCRAN